MHFAIRADGGKEIGYGHLIRSSTLAEETLPRELDVEAFTFDRSSGIERAATKPSEREHVTPYYRQHPDRFYLVNVRAEEAFDSETLPGGLIFG